MRTFIVGLMTIQEMPPRELFSGVFGVEEDIAHALYKNTFPSMDVESCWLAFPINYAIKAYHRQCETQGVEPAKVTSIVMSEVI